MVRIHMEELKGTSIKLPKDNKTLVSWEARVGMRIFSTFSISKKKKCGEKS